VRNRYGLIKELSERLRAAVESGDPTGVLDNAVPRLARDLAETLTQDSLRAAAPDVVEALRVLAAVHWMRYQLLPGGRGQDDLQACLKWSAALLSVAPDLVPEPARAYLADPDTPVGATAAAEATDRGMALYEEYQQTANLQLLQAATLLFREAADTTPADHPDRPWYLSNLGTALWKRYERTGWQADLDQAITWLSEAVDATPADQPDRTMYLYNLAIALRTRFERTGQRADLNQAIEVYREGAGMLTAPPAWRVGAARGWGRCALLAGDGGSAVEGYTAAIELLPLMAWHGLDQATREHHLREWAGLASDAAAAAIAAGDPARAVELLEAGRSMLWTQALHLRQDLAALRERAPGLAAALEASRAVLNASSAGVVRAPDTASDVDQAQAAEEQMLEERRQAARDWDAAVDQVRRIEGFEHFLRPVPFTALQAAATTGPVVIVNISQHGSHALIVTGATAPHPDPAVLVVDLPAAPMDTVIDQANTLLSAVDGTDDPATGRPTKEDDRHSVFNVLAWSWEAITEPVLTALRHTHTPRGRIEDWPRVWWCPTGPATVLPLHASGRHPRTTTQYAVMGEAAALADSVAGRVISSYTPTLTSLTKARTRLVPGRVRQLAVGVPEAPSYVPGAGALPGVPVELQVLADYLPTPEHATHLLGLTATRQAVLEALPGHSWLHLSCHGVQDRADASLSAFLLHDQPLTLADLAALNLGEIDMAYLAACQTASGDLRLLDEALHLAGALQLVGYRHVLATLWSISDAAAPVMVDITYAHLLHDDPDHPNPTDWPQAARAPYALHHAVTRLRQAHPGEPMLWAPYIHLGP
jgi:CHAT domain